MQLCSCGQKKVHRLSSHGIHKKTQLFRSGRIKSKKKKKFHCLGASFLLDFFFCNFTFYQTFLSIFLSEQFFFFRTFHYRDHFFLIKIFSLLIFVVVVEIERRSTKAHPSPLNVSLSFIEDYCIGCRSLLKKLKCLTTYNSFPILMWPL